MNLHLSSPCPSHSFQFSILLVGCSISQNPPVTFSSMREQWFSIILESRTFENTVNDVIFLLRKTHKYSEYWEFRVPRSSSVDPWLRITTLYDLLFPWISHVIPLLLFLTTCFICNLTNCSVSNFDQRYAVSLCHKVL